MQNELAGLIESIEGVEQAKVMINMPEKSVFVKDKEEKATASIILQTEPGYEFDQKQVKSLYHLVSKSVPNLPTENIVIRNQHLEYFDLDESGYADSGFDKQMQVKKQIERDIQRQVQEMLGTLMGYDKVMTSVTADIDFTQENREENLVTPVDEENMRGIAISAQRITETFSGGEGQAGGVPQASDPADAGTGQYVEGAVNEGESERNEETINYEVNKIRKEIVESPYKIRDLGIQVVVEPPEPDEQASLPQERIDDIREILSTIVRTSIDKGAEEEITDEEIENKVVVSVQPFNGKAFEDETKPAAKLPWWAFVVLAVLIAVIAALIFLWARNMKANGQEVTAGGLEPVREAPIGDINEPDVDKTPIAYRRQLEILAKENPEQFAELLRTWLVDDEEA
jgi:flagellar M-ring protein FliF